MCGIAAFFAYHYASPGVDREELKAVRDAMAHRGPDGSGEWFSSDGRVALGHRRLAILDLTDSGAQPMAAPDRSAIISFNGEIYNFREIRERLEKKGIRFTSHTDTEVLLQLYLEKGEGMFAELRGMYAFALWDASRKALLLARDPLGIKPLYYADDGWMVRAASEVKALLAGGKVSRLREPAAAAGFFLWGSVPEPWTLYQEIRSVPAGSFLWVDASGPGPAKKHFSVAQVWSEAAAAPLPFDPEKFRDRLIESVRYHFVSDVPVAIFLSAGLDSGALVAFSRESGPRDLQTLTLSFREFKKGSAQDESALSEEMAQLYGTRHTEDRIGLEEVRGLLPGFFKAMDQPTIDGLNTYLVSRMAAREKLKVALSGLGSDELFGGYSSFNEIPSWVARMKPVGCFPGAGKFARMILSMYMTRRPKAAGMPEYGGRYEGAYFLKRGLFMPWELPALVGDADAEEGLRRLHGIETAKNALIPDPGTPHGRVSALEMSLYMRNQLLRDADWAGMAHSVEIRVPFADSALLKVLAPLLLSPGRNWKKELAKSPRPPLPPALIARPKTGFVVPIERWLREDDSLGTWKSNRALSRQECHWARRWAFEVFHRMSVS